ncbi:transposase family protein [Candidatus Vondammii sp. HM_W22]|uniref:transposase family protein n=1 Tax=Candidatus Vondammii sp. HM_W22 TaxID=2687299 RepID=UPI002E7BE559|nr:transposase family protein [Candidatus Vondammii sp. HM_W22]
MFEALVIDWLKEVSISAVSRLMGLSWNAIDGIMQRAVKRGLARRTEISPTRWVLMRRSSRNAMIMQQSYQTRMQVQCHTWAVTAKRRRVRKSDRGAARSDRECLHGYVASFYQCHTEKPA